MKPRLLDHFDVRFEPPGSSGEEGLVFTSERKRVVIKGHSFREFLQDVVPLLDGRHSVEEIHARVKDVFDAGDLDTCLALLSEQGLLEDAETVGFDPELERTIAPQLNYFREVSSDPVGLQDRLAEATVTVAGLGGIGAVAATALAACGIGRIRAVDHLSVAPTDPFLGQVFDRADVGARRAEAVRDKIAAVNAATTVEVHAVHLDSDDAAVAAAGGADFVLSCFDPGLSAFAYRLNRACLHARVRSCSGAVSAFEGIVGPTVLPYETACYLCYQMRAVACSDDPEEAFEHLKALDRRRRDGSPHRENLAFGFGIVGNMLALEAFRSLLGVKPPTAGRVAVVDFSRLTTQTHVVLRKPWCPACFAGARNPQPGTGPAGE